MSAGLTFPPFRPLPFLSNPHIQTILGNLVRSSEQGLASQHTLLLLPDGDQLMLHDSRPPTWTAGEPLLLLVHGLGGCARSGYMVRVARQLVRRGWRCVRLDQRGAGTGWNLARRTYNASASGDVWHVLEYLHAGAPTSPLFLVGFSLGGNIVLKLAAEAAEQPVPGLAGVAALNAPIDLERCCHLLASPRNRFYNRYFVQLLKEQIARRERHLPDIPRVALNSARTLRDIDELYTAPLGGFRDALDYYRRSAALPLLGRVGLPTLLLTARDDPFIAVESYEELSVADGRTVVISERGGHLGFLGWAGRWAESVLVGWLIRQLTDPTLRR